MATNVTMGRLLGFKDFFPEDEIRAKEYYAQQAGKDLIETFCCYLLGYFRHGAIPAIPQLLQIWFTFMGRPYFSSPSYWHVISKYKAFTERDKYGGKHAILSEESLLNLFIWVKSNPDIPKSVEPMDASVMLNMFYLTLLFNEDVLANYEKAVTSANKVDNKVLKRMFLANSFPQSDIMNVDYAQLMYTQFYKLTRLLSFMEANADYQSLFHYLLGEFKCGSKQEFLKAIGGAVFTPFKGHTPGWSALSVDKAGDVQKSMDFLDKLSIDEDVLSTDQNDYLQLRDKPFQKLENGDYRIIFDLFLVKKLYNGVIFKLSAYSNKFPDLFKGFLGRIRDEFSEAVLVYETLESIFKPLDAVIKTGNEFKAAKVQREPDFYSRVDNTIGLFESKDFFMPGVSKLSYDFDVIESELRDGRLGKAVKQLTKNIERVLTKTLVLDDEYDLNDVTVYPVVIVHDSLYSCTSLNAWVNDWLQEELEALKQDERFAGFDFSRILPVTVVEIDTLIIYTSHFQSGQLNFFALLELFHQHVRLDLTGDQADQHILQSILPFSEFVRDYGYSVGIQLNMDSLRKIYKEYNLE